MNILARFSVALVKARETSPNEEPLACYCDRLFAASRVARAPRVLDFSIL